MRPLGNKVLIEPSKAPEISHGGIITPEAYRQRDVAWDGVVKALGYTNKLNLSIGDRVLVNRYSVTIVPGPPELWLAKPEDIIATMEYT